MKGLKELLILFLPTEDLTFKRKKKFYVEGKLLVAYTSLSLGCIKCGRQG
jgi:hypothetical protein